MQHTDNLLARLQKVRSIREGQWVACCPAHDDHEPSMAVKEKDDGRVLVYCRSGCTTNEVLSALNMTMRDLYPQEQRPPAQQAAKVDVLYERIFVATYRAAFGDLSMRVSEADTTRYTLAMSRLQSAGVLAI